MSFWNVNYTTVIDYVTPPSKRKSVFLSFVNALLSPLQTLNNALFNAYFADLQKRAKRTGQKIILEKTLNEVFVVPPSTPIFIDNNGDDIDPIYFYNDGESYPPIYFYNEGESYAPIYFYNEGELDLNGLFTVYVPFVTSATYPDVKISSEVNKYAPFGTKHKIINY